MGEGLFHNQTFVEYVNEYAVAVVGHREQHTMEERRNPLTGEVEQVCPHYDTIPCSAHQTSYQQAGSRFQFQYTPSNFITDQKGERLFGPDDVPRTPQGIIELFQRAQQKIGVQPLTGSMILRMERDLYKGDAKASDGKFGKARDSYQEVLDDEEIPEFVKAKARARLASLHDRIVAAIDAAKAEGGSKGRRELKKLIRELRDMEEEKALAEEALAELEG